MGNRYTIRFTNSMGFADQQSAGESETIALLDKLPKLGAHTITVVSSDGGVWSGEDALKHLAR